MERVARLDVSTVDHPDVHQMCTRAVVEGCQTRSTCRRSAAARRQDVVSRVIHFRLVAEISIRDLRNHGGEVVDRVALGEELTITRDGKPVARLRPLDKPPLSVTALLLRWARLPPMDPDALRRDIDASVDPSL